MSPKWVLGFSFGLALNPVIGIAPSCTVKLVNCLTLIKTQVFLLMLVRAIGFRGSVVNAEAFKVVLNLCREAKPANEGFFFFFFFF
jgi:hypothetical protein